MVTVEEIRASLRDESAIESLLRRVPHPPTVRQLLRRRFFGRRWSVTDHCDFWLSSNGKTVVCLIIRGANPETIERIRAAYDALRPNGPPEVLSHDFVTGLVKRVLREVPPRTLGELLYAKIASTPPAEAEWIELVRAMGAGNPHALHSLYQRTHRIAFALMMQLAQNSQVAGELVLDGFRDVWRLASNYDARDSSVLGWILNQMRRHAIERLHFEQGGQRVHAFPDPSTTAATPADETALAPIWGRLAQRLAIDAGREVAPSSMLPWTEPEWEDVGGGISCKLLAGDQDRLSMLVQLAPRAEYPPHRHAGIEELHLLQGELWIDDRKLYPGDYNHAQEGTADKRIWSETGCICVLITSPADPLQ